MINHVLLASNGFGKRWLQDRYRCCSSSAPTLTTGEMEEMTYQDRSLTCVQCGSAFNFTADDQQFHASRGYQDPKRCPTCRAERRSSQGGGYGSSSSYGGSSYGGGYDRPQREMHVAVCARCGGEARVPFVPRGDKPVYCSNCYQPAPRW